MCAGAEKSQVLAGACYYFRPSNPHSGTLWALFCLQLRYLASCFAAAWQRWELQCFVADLCAITNYFYCDPVLFTSTPSCRRSHVSDRALFINSILWDKCCSYILHDWRRLAVVKAQSLLQLWSFMLGPNIGSRPVCSSGSGFAVLSLNNLSSLAAAVFTEEAAIRQYHLSGPGRGIRASKIVLFYSILCRSIGKLEN